MTHLHLAGQSATENIVRLIRSPGIWLSLLAMVSLLYGCNEQTQVPVADSPVAKAALSATQPGSITAPRIIAADSEPENWLAHGCTYDEQRFSPLQQINRENVEQLGLAWEYRMH